MRRSIVVLVALAGFGTARLARVVAAGERGEDAIARPYSPSPGAAPFVSLGYRELFADILYARMLGYFGGPDHEGPAIAELSEAIAALDPTFRRNYDVGPIAMTAAHRGVDNSIHLRAIALLERASVQFPDMFRYPNLAGQIYIVDLKTDDPAQRRDWDEKGALLLESAARKPNAPADAGLQAAVLQTRFGQQQRAIEKLRELILITEDKQARESLLKKLGELTQDNADDIAAELLDSRRAFEREWNEKRPAIPATFYILLGPQLGTTFDLTDLATGGRDVIAIPTSATSEDGPSSP
ncbi:MAG: hypothetical protein AB7T06_06570 [Kofleriaceae bacterium]